ncbi:MAG: ChbG/HpnK family deacetylase, partial [Acidobacteria bacterium]
VFNPSMFPMYVKLAREYSVPFFCPRVAAGQPAIAGVLREDDPLMDGMAMASPTVKPEGWPAFYEDVLKQLKPGLTYLIVHLGYNDAELQAVMSEQAPFGAAWRQRDFDVLTSPGFARAIKDNGVILVGWKDVKKLMTK